ncbi:hypothetical protein V502_04053 [Pseudogymnoascus sp. VKM F-4520 (FW-2644)]|nr:hypothetical protein V502_04053 [Pseudogymnoascus sp. VKM F-4520 (FW-2644)]
MFPLHRFTAKEVQSKGVKQGLKRNNAMRSRSLSDRPGFSGAPSARPKGKLVEMAIGALDDVAYGDFLRTAPLHTILLRYGALLVHARILASAGFASVEPLGPKAIAGMNGTSTASTIQRVSSGTGTSFKRCPTRTVKSL